MFFLIQELIKIQNQKLNLQEYESDENNMMKKSGNSIIKDKNGKKKNKFNHKRNKINKSNNENLISEDNKVEKK